MAKTTAERPLLRPMQGHPGYFYALSRSEPGKVYTTQVVDGHAVCNCKAGASGQNCAHMKEALAMTQATTSPGTDLATRQSADLVPEGLEPIEFPARTTPKGLVPTLDELGSYRTIALWGSRLAGQLIPQGLDTPPKVMAVMLMGWEWDVPPMTALTEFFVVNGKVQPSARLMASRVMSRDPRIEISYPVYEQDRVVCVLKRPGKEPVTVEYNRAMAIAAGQIKRQWLDGEITEKDSRSPWLAYERDMHAANAVKRCIRLGAPDHLIVTATMGVPMTAIDDVSAFEFQKKTSIPEGAKQVQAPSATAVDPAALGAAMQKSGVSAQALADYLGDDSLEAVAEALESHGGSLETLMEAVAAVGQSTPSTDVGE